MRVDGTPFRSVGWYPVDHLVIPIIAEVTHSVEVDSHVESVSPKHNLK